MPNTLSSLLAVLQIGIQSWWQLVEEHHLRQRHTITVDGRPPVVFAECKSYPLSIRTW